MKKLLLLFFICNFIFVIPASVYSENPAAEESVTDEEITPVPDPVPSESTQTKSALEETFLGKKINEFCINILKQEQISNSLATIKANWEGLKNWFNNLPGIRNYNESMYSKKNWKKTMRSMGIEYSPELKKNSAGVSMVKEGKKKWDKL